MRSTILPFFVALMLPAAVLAQGFNIDADHSAGGAGTGVPADTFAGAANMAGRWNAVAGVIGGAITLRGLDGQLTSVTLSRSGNGSNVGSDNPNTTLPGFGLLLDDVQSVGTGSTTWTLAGLASGTYRVYTYAISPSSSTARTSVTISGSTQTVGGAMPLDSFAPLVTHATHTVSSTGTITVTIANSTGVGSINGMQIVPVLSRIYVRASASGLNSGTSWANAFRSLQSALDTAAAQSGAAEIWVAAGLYTPTVYSGNRRAATFPLLNNVSLYGGFAGTETSLSQRDWNTNVTTLSGELGATDAWRVVTAQNVTSSAVLDGFTIRDGYAVTGIDTPSDAWGAGIGMVAADPLIRNCRFAFNTAEGGGGAADVSNSDPSFLECSFSFNTVSGSSGTTGYRGGAIRIRDGSYPYLRNCGFSLNTSTGEGGAVAIVGASALIAGCVFTINASSGFNNSFGGALAVVGGGDIDIWNCTVLDNQCSRSDGAGGFDLSGTADVTLLNNVLWNNSAGGAFTLSAQVFRGVTTLSMSNNVTRGGVLAGTANEGGDPPTYDPALADSLGHLLPSSRLIDSGSDAISLFLYPQDFEGNPRQTEISSRPISNPSATTLTDRGAYEYTRRRYVRANAPAGGAGTTWATAYRKLQDALAFAAGDPDATINEIFVAAGTYLPDETDAVPSGTDDRNAAFSLRSNLAIRGGFAGSETNAALANPTANVTTLSGAIGGASTSDNSYHVVLSNAHNGTAIFDGFRIVAGNASGTGGGSASQGGGMRLSNSSAQVSRCTFEGNNASTLGGGAYALGASGSTPLNFTNCTFQNNTAGAAGAGLYFTTSTARTFALQSCSFSGNVVPTTGSAGGGAFADLNPSASISFSSCTFDANTAPSGAAMRIQGDGGTAFLSTVSILNHNATSPSANGGAMSIADLATCSLVGVTFTGNHAADPAPFRPLPFPANGEILSCTTTMNGAGVTIEDGILDIGPTAFYLDAGSITGAAIKVGSGATLRFTESTHPGVRLNAEITGIGPSDVGNVDCSWGGTVWLGSNAAIDLSGGDVAGGQRSPVGTLTINKQFRMGNNAENPPAGAIGIVQNCNIVINNDQTCSNSAGGYIAMVNRDSRLRWNAISARGENYLRYLFPEAPFTSTNLGNVVSMTIDGNIDADSRKELLEARQPPFNSGTGFIRLPASPPSSGFTQPFAIESLTLNPYSDVSVVSTADELPIGTPDVAYIRRIRIGPNATFNSGVGTTFFETLEVQQGVGGPWVPVAGPPFPSPLTPESNARVISAPLMGFALGVIRMESDCEFDVRVTRSPADQSRVRRLDVGAGLPPCNWPTNVGYMEMKTEAAAAVAAKGTFIKAAGDTIVVQFLYLFQASTPLPSSAAIDVYLSDSPYLGDRNLHLATIRQPAPARAGAIGSCRFAEFHMRLPLPAGMTFDAGTYVELVLRNPGSVVWIDEFDPLIQCTSGVCYDFNGLGNVDSIDYLIATGAYGEDLDPFGPVVRLCLDHKHGDAYADMSDFYGNESYINAASTNNPCGLNLSSSGTTTPATTPSGTRLLIAGRPADSNLAARDRLYPATLTGSSAGSSFAPPAWIGPRSRGRGNGRLITDPFGELYQLNATEGLTRLRDGRVILSRQVFHSPPGFPGMTIYVGAQPFDPVDPDLPGRPILDAAWDKRIAPGQLEPEELYVAPVTVRLADGFTYTPAAKLLITQGAGGAVTVSLEALFGADPRSESATQFLVEEEPNEPLVGAYEPDYSRVREIEVDRDGYVYIASAQAVGDNDWLLAYDADDPSPQPPRLAATLLNIDAPSAMLLASDGNLYLTSSQRQPGRTARVFRYLPVRSPHVSGFTRDAAFNETVGIYPPLDTLPAGVADQACTITALVETFDHRILAVGFCMPNYDNEYIFTSAPQIAMKPTLAAYNPATNAWSPNGSFLSLSNLALPVAATIVGCGMDLDGDGLIGLTDLATLLANFGRSDPNVRPHHGDVNNDGAVDLTDLAVLLTAFGGPCP